MPVVQPNPTGNGQARDPLLAANAAMFRSELMRKLLDPRRSIYDECGFPSTGSLTPQHFQDLYDREAIAARVVEVMPKECWGVQPLVYENPDPNKVTEFEEAWDALGNSLKPEESYYQEEESSCVWEYLLRADILSGIGQYGTILLGLDDGEEDLARPAKKRDGQGLLYLRCFPESLCPITAFETDSTSPRYGHPTKYSITFNDPSVQHSGTGLSTVTREVHWSRVIHVVDTNHTAPTSEVFGIQRMKPVLNNLTSLQKLYGGSGEMYWRGAFPGYALRTDPSLGGDVELDLSATRDMMEDYMNGLQRYFALKGMSVETMSPQVVDPTPQIAAQIKAICIKLSVPVPIFEGYEIGSLASAENKIQWNERLKGRQNRYITPRVIMPLVDRLISLGVLPKPKSANKKLASNRKIVVKMGRRLLVNEYGKVVGEASKGGYVVEWPDMNSQTELEKADIASKKVAALAAYVAGNVEALYPPMDFLTRILGHTEKDAEAILENAAELMEEREEEEALKQEEQIELQKQMIDEGVKADPNLALEAKMGKGLEEEEEPEEEEV